MRVYDDGIRGMTGREQRSRRRALRLRRERRRRAVTLSVAAVTTFCVIMAIAISCSTIRSNAGSGFKYYTSVTVEAGESLWELAEEYIDYRVYKDRSSYIAEVKRINHLDEKGTVFAGQVLIVPYYSMEYVY